MIGLRRGVHYEFNQRSMTYTWWNGSETIFTNLDDEEKFGSVEASTWAIDEGSEVPDSVYRTIFPSRLRWHLPGCPASTNPDAECAGCPHRAWVCTNPGASGYLKSATKGKLPGWAWFPVKPGENTHNPPGYNEMLERMARLYGPAYYARYVEGSWESFEGQRFPMLDRELHVIDDWQPGPTHDIYEGWDFGWRNPTAVIWIAVHPKGEEPPIVFHEYEESQREIPKIAADIKLIRRHYGLDPRHIISVGDPAGNQTHGSGQSDIHLFSQNGIDITPAFNLKSPGPRARIIAALLNRRMATRAGVLPGILICRRCPKLYEALTEYRVVPERSTGGLDQDAPEKFVKRNDHLVDAGGYGIGALPLNWDEILREAGAPVEVPDGVSRGAPTPAELDRMDFAPPQEDDGTFELFGIRV